MKINTLAILLLITTNVAVAHSNQDDKTKNERKFVEIITPNHASINPSSIDEYTSNYIVYLKSELNERESIGSFSEQVQHIQLNDQKAFRIKKEYVVNGKEHTQLSMLSASSLKPRYIISKSEDMIQLVNFDGKEIKGEIVLDGKSRKYTDASDVPYFDVQTSDLIMRSLPLDKGYSAMFWAYNADKLNSLDYQSISVIDEVKTKNNEQKWVDAWVVEKTDSDSTSVYTIDKSSRAILKVEMLLANGKTMVIERI